MSDLNVANRQVISHKRFDFLGFFFSLEGFFLLISLKILKGTSTLPEYRLQFQLEFPLELELALIADTLGSGVISEGLI